MHQINNEKKIRHDRNQPVLVVFWLQSRAFMSQSHFSKEFKQIWTI